MKKLHIRVVKHGGRWWLGVNQFLFGDGVKSKDSAYSNGVRDLVERYMDMYARMDKIKELT